MFDVQRSTDVRVQQATRFGNKVKRDPHTVTLIRGIIIRVSGVRVPPPLPANQGLRLLSQISALPSATI